MFDKSVPLGATIAQSSAKILVGAGLALGLFAAPMPVHAAGDGGGSSSTPTPTCKKNYVYNKHKLKCVKAEKSR